MAARDRSDCPGLQVFLDHQGYQESGNQVGRDSLVNQGHGVSQDTKGCPDPQAPRGPRGIKEWVYLGYQVRRDQVDRRGPQAKEVHQAPGNRV